MNGTQAANREGLLVVTDRAQREIRTIFQQEEHGENVGLRLSVIGGGCSGLSYEMDFSQARTDDSAVEFDGFSVLLDPKSTIYLKGITLDFQDGLQGRGFVFANPNATNTCGCGESFSI